MNDFSFHLMFGSCLVFQFYALFPNKFCGPYLDAFHKILPPKTLLNRKLKSHMPAPHVDFYCIESSETIIGNKQKVWFDT